MISEHFCIGSFEAQLQIIISDDVIPFCFSGSAKSKDGEESIKGKYVVDSAGDTIFINL